jgi:hypothetical protein
MELRFPVAKQTFKYLVFQTRFFTGEQANQANVQKKQVKNSESELKFKATYTSSLDLRKRRLNWVFYLSTCEAKQRKGK